ncbi:integral membrane protein [Tirmania nivea]|nr:integral membrane protein [Tirmania nivea]
MRTPRHRHLPLPLSTRLLLLLNLFPGLSHAQGLAVSVTAAWSSQIIAFWGAVIIGVRTCPRALITNAFTALICNLSILHRTIRITRLLRNGDWYLHSGWDNGRTRTDVVILCWREEYELWRLVLQVVMQLETVGDRWEVLICSRKLRCQSTNSTIQVHGRWMQSPRCEGFCGTRTSENGHNHFPLSNTTIAEAVLAMQTPSRDRPEEIAARSMLKRDSRATRCTYFTEARAELQDETSPARHVTCVVSKEGEMPFIAGRSGTSDYGLARTITLRNSPWMYGVVHVTITVAIGLMAAAAGRGLAIWLFLLRPMMATAGMAAKMVCDNLGYILGFDGVQLVYESGFGASSIAGDLICWGMSRWWMMYSCALLVLEATLVIGGWIYGALQVTKSKPSGLVGHGMLILATAVGLTLSIRSMIGTVKKQLPRRLVGTFAYQEYLRNVVGTSVEIRMDDIRGKMRPCPQIQLVNAILQEHSDDHVAVTFAGDFLRHPDSGTAIIQYVIENLLKYQYNQDAIVSKGDPPTPVSAAREYPWIWSVVCNIVTAGCSIVSVAYAYLQMPWWVKLMVEVLLGLSAVGYATLEKVGNLPHNRDSYLSHMVATMVVSAVWYVGVDSLG